MAKKRSKVQKARFVQPTKGSSKKQPAKKKGEQEEAGGVEAETCLHRSTGK